MGGLVIANAETTRQYGVLGTRYNTFREFYGCVREAINTNEPVEDCL